jgi:hypothetical protein
MSITYEAVLDVSERSARFLSKLLHEERVRRGTRKDTRSLSTYKQAVLVLRWFLDDTRMSALATDNEISRSTAYDYRDEGIAVLAARKPSLRNALLAAKAAGHTHVIVDGTLIETDRSPPLVPLTGWTCGGRASTSTTAGTSRWCPLLTDGRCGPPTCGRDGSTT